MSQNSMRTFKFLQLFPENKAVPIEKLLSKYVSMQTQEGSMKCGGCCPHPGSSCPHTGDCARKVNCRNVITGLPKYLFIQLQRCDRSGRMKTKAVVKIGSEVDINGTS